MTEHLADKQRLRIRLDDMDEVGRADLREFLAALKRAIAKSPHARLTGGFDVIDRDGNLVVPRNKRTGDA